MSATDDKNNQFRHFRDDEEPVSLQPTVNDGEPNIVENKSSGQDESFDYIIPEESYKEHEKRKRKHKSSKKIRVETVNIDGVEAPDSDYVFSTSESERHHHHHHHHHHHRRRKSQRKPLALWKRILIIVLSVLLALVILVAGTFFVLNEIGRRGLLDYNDVGVVVPTEDESGNDVIQVDNSGRVITYDGMSYELNENLITIPFIGVDEGSEHNNTNLQMADAIYVLTIDTQTGKIKVLSISRDTMADVDLYSEEGRFIETERLQIAFSYAYGNEEVTGGKNTTTSISRLFYGLPFDNYFAINMDALVDLNDAIGGVTLTSSMTFTSPVDGRTIYEGEQVTLHGKEADTYVRSRDISQLDSNNDRMARQMEYIKAFLNSVIPAVKNDISVVSDLYGVIQDNSDTTLNLPKMTYIASTAVTKLRNASDIEYVSLRGEITKGKYAEMKITNETAIRTMLDMFYTPLAKVPDTTK